MNGADGIVVVGAGMAATRLVEGLVRRGIGPVTVLGREPDAPYNRILLSALLEGTHREDALALRPASWWASHDVELRTDARVEALDRERHEVRLADGTVVPYRTLVLASGSIPVLPPVRGVVGEDGALHPAVHAFRTLADVRRLEAALAPGDVRRAVVVGGGLLGLQVARALTVRGLVVEVVEGAEHLMRSQLGERGGAVLARDLERRGTHSYTGARAVRVTETSEGTGLVLDNGYTLSTDLVVLSAGARPATGLAQRAGLAVGRGVVVDETLTTSDADVHAIGDCAEHAGRTTGFVAPAWEQAETLAAHLAGASARYTGTRTVARLRATDLDVAVLGEPREAAAEPGAQVVEMTNPVTCSHRRLVVQGGAVVAAELVGDLSRIGLITQHFDRRTVLGPLEPGALLSADRPSSGSAASVTSMPDEAEVCTCAGVSAGAIRACSSLEQARDSTRAGTGCGGCAPVVRQLLATRPSTQGARS
ncbi:FAD/NAD(P)-binding oxidoreductase [Marmoricola endophyticus]|uniref:FAD/NAD(P)-binding oxidoreductase n=1 Tax=Marmoricola endophyticus TaxID=2040280 RepID=A0A917BRK0_9ACTN|nr:FAD-dependent oxidoreductase [Marmoricola endophyticus]GGF53393.1 FAD/NAD(P)-binding oxidoreductase [Marmoricola endophyticus]